LPADIRGNRLEIDGTQYQESQISDWIGFYDWLRSSDESMVGVRLFVDEKDDERKLRAATDGSASFEFKFLRADIQSHWPTSVLLV
jgi:hypothetical protein